MSVGGKAATVIVWAVWWLCLWPILAVCRIIYKLAKAVRGAFVWIERNDPMPWRQAALLAVAFSAIIIMALICPN